jgi:biotin transport system substrate-specific component
MDIFLKKHVSLSKNELLAFGFLKDILLIIFASLFLALFSKISIPLFFTPVPIALHNSISIGYGYFLKSKRAFLAVFLFIILGATGLPFFANGNFGMHHLFSTNCGYIFGYSIAAYIIGNIFEKKEKLTTKFIALNVLFGHLIVLFLGWAWFSTYVGMKTAFILGVAPFIAGDIFKSVLLTKLIKYFAE